MKIESLNIERRPSYDDLYPKQLVGLIKLTCGTGTQEVKLTNKGLARIFEVIREEVAGTAMRNAAEVKHAMRDGMDETLEVYTDKLREISF